MKIGTALNYYFSGIFVYLKDNIFVNWLFWAGTVGNVTLIKIIIESQKIQGASKKSGITVVRLLSVVKN